MPDFGSPVAQNVNPIGQGLQSLSQIMNYKTQQQGLQLGAQQLQIGQSNVQQAQQQMKERQGIQQMMQSGVDDQGNSIKDASGNPDPAKVLPALGRIAPLTGQPYAQMILKTHSDNIGLQAASASLDSQERGMLMAPVQAAAVDPNAKSADINAGIDNLVKAHPEMENAATYLKNLTPHLDSAPPNQRAQVAQQIAARMQPGQGVQTQPTSGSVNNGAVQSQGAFAAPVAGGGFTPATQVRNQIAPGAISATDANGRPILINPQDATTRSPSGDATKSTSIPDAARFNEISADNQKGQSMVALSQQVANLSDQVRTGKLSKEWTDRLAVLQQNNPQITARQMLGKYAAQLKTMGEAGAATDAERSTVEAGMPNPDSQDPDAVKEAAQYIGGMGAMRNARDQVASKYIQQNGGTNGLRSVDDQFMQHADPFVYTYKSLAPGPDRQQFLLKKFGDGSQITNPVALKQFLDQQNIVKHYGG